MSEEEPRKIPAIVLIGVGGGGSRILSEGLDKLLHREGICKDYI